MTRLVPLSAVLALWGCQNASGTQGPPQMPPSPVEVVTVTPGPVEITSDYVATLVSRQAVSLYAQVSGYVRAIPRMPGAQVKQGDVLVELESAAERATLENLAATRTAQASQASFAAERLERAEALIKEGIVSQQTADEARSAAEQARASLAATEALIASQRARLGYFRVTAPLDGVVGHVPVKVGDLVTPATLLTSVTQQSALEAEVYVPAGRAVDLGPDSRVRLVGPDGTVVGEQPVSFVAPKADPATQLVLVKAVFPPIPGLIADQSLRARVVWRRYEGLTIPPVAVIRQAGQPFGFVVERKDEVEVVKKVPLQLGPVQERGVVVEGGLDAGARLVVSGMQTLQDGAAVSTRPAGITPGEG